MAEKGSVGRDQLHIDIALLPTVPLGGDYRAILSTKHSKLWCAEAYYVRRFLKKLMICIERDSLGPTAFEGICHPVPLSFIEDEAKDLERFLALIDNSVSTVYHTPGPGETIWAIRHGCSSGDSQYALDGCAVVFQKGSERRLSKLRWFTNCVSM